MGNRRQADVQIKEDTVILTMKIIPNAKKNAIMSDASPYLKVKIHAAPQEGAANEALIDYFSALFKIPKKNILILSGKTSRLKKIQLPLAPLVKAFLEEMQIFH